MAPSTPALTALARAGVRHTVHEYETSDRDGRHAYGQEAAGALGVESDRIFKTLVATVDGRIVIAVVPVAGSLDLKALAQAVDGRRASMADPAEAERVTGYVLGGISPLGQRRRSRTVLDRSALRHPAILVSAGRRGCQVELAGEDLRRLTDAVVAAISRTDPPS
jgi:Cys-tRNA(Pro)/Cys-tRNA(Cys) deacylase